ncbi:MAG: hypothetical protein AB7H43_03080 [Acidimicrobiia bacterium]
MRTGTEPRWPVAAGVAVGAALAVVGVRSLLAEPGDTKPAATALWVVGLAVAHDLVLAPLVMGVGVAVKRFAPAWLRPWLGAGLIVSGAVGLVAWPLVRGYGRSAGNPSILPRDYTTGTVVVLVAVWGAIGLGLLAGRIRHRPGRRRARS